MRAIRGRKPADPSMQDGTRIGLRCAPLSEQDVQKVHRAALDLLQDVGLANPTPRVRELCIEHGCTLVEDGRLAFPRSLIEDVISNASKSFPVHGRDDRFSFEAKSGSVRFCTGGAAVQMLDMDTGRYRPSTLRDIYDLSRLCDTLESIHWFTRPVVATDIQDIFELDVNTVLACAMGTRKHIATSFCNGEHVYRIAPMLDMIAGGSGRFRKKPFCTVHATTVVSPMTFARDGLDAACAAVDIGMPVHCLTGPQAGATAPAALAGTLAQGCAESLATLAVVNLLKPGHPTILGNWTFVCDLRTGAFCGGGAEQALLGAASGQMSAFYGVPGGMGASMTDSKLPDYQAGFEKAFTLIMAALSGGGLVYESAGMLASLIGCSLEAMVMDNEILSILSRLARGIEVTDETLSVSVVRDCARQAGHFLGHSQTISLMESEYVYPKLADRSPPAAWYEAGAVGMREKAAAVVRQTLDTHQPRYISGKAERLIREHYPVRF